MHELMSHAGQLATFDYAENLENFWCICVKIELNLRNIEKSICNFVLGEISAFENNVVLIYAQDLQRHRFYSVNYPTTHFVCL